MSDELDDMSSPEDMFWWMVRRLGTDRDETGSRARIIGYLTLRQGRWTRPHAALAPLNTWSEDLQALVREGIVQCQDPVDKMSMLSFVRLL